MLPATQGPLATTRGFSMTSVLDCLLPLPILSQVNSCSPDSFLPSNGVGAGLKEQRESLNELILGTQQQVSL